MAQLLLRAALALLCCHTAGAHDHHGRVDNNVQQNEFTPPKLTFTASNYLASLKKDGNTVKSVQENENEEVPWTIFQAVEGVEGSTTHKEKILRRSGPLLTLFPDVPPKGTLEISAYEYDHNKYAKHVVLTPDEQREYLDTHGKQCYQSIESASSTDILSKYDTFMKTPTLSNFAIELWKYCALYIEGGVYVDAETAPLAALGDVLNWSTNRKNYAVISTGRDAGVSPNLLDGPDAQVTDSVLTASSLGTGNPIAISSMIAIGTKGHSVPQQMIVKLMLTPIETLEEDALLLPKTLMSLIDKENESGEDKSNSWGLLNQRCNGIEVATSEKKSTVDDVRFDGQHRNLRHCPSSSGYCCEVLDPTSNFVFLLSRHSLVPNQVLPAAIPRPYQCVEAQTKADPTITNEMIFMSTIIQHKTSTLIASNTNGGTTEKPPNVYEVLQSQNALPNQESNKKACDDCLREKKGANCEMCAEKCPNFCTKLCEVELKEKPVTRVLSITPPRYKKDPERNIPRIVHQTWFEPVTSDKYPNMSRLIESWKRSGWQYHFWDDNSAAAFLSTHFPPEIREAYDSILPGAFKADLFRYCVLLIQGGIYADMDVMLESNLDAAVPPDVGFMVPVDAPGIKPDKRMCLWNGFIASAPGHPYLSRVIERVTNNIRNRFTVVDYDRMMCPAPELSVVHAFSTLFTAGPCILGLTINEVMGRELQQTFVEGDLETPDGSRVEGVPGRTIILQQNKWDMGAHRFTWVENNLVVAGEYICVLS